MLLFGCEDIVPWIPVGSLEYRQAIDIFGINIISSYICSRDDEVWYEVSKINTHTNTITMRKI